MPNDELPPDTHAPAPPVPPAPADTGRLSPEQQELFIQLLLRGASPYAACQQLNLPIRALFRSQTDDVEFRERIDQTRVLLSQNVAAALYRSALEGNVSAQTFWLKACPPPGWSREDDSAARPQTFDETLERLSDDELVQLARSLGVELPAEDQADLAAPPSDTVAG